MMSPPNHGRLDAFVIAWFANLITPKSWQGGVLQPRTKGSPESSFCFLTQFTISTPPLVILSATQSPVVVVAVQEIEMVFKTYGEVADVHVISGDRVAGAVPLFAAWLSQHFSIVSAAKSQLIIGMRWNIVRYLYYTVFW